ncbi:MAG: hypothetical protein ACO1N7_08100 [Sphingobacteriaceae bacterium]
MKYSKIFTLLLTGIVALSSCKSDDPAAPVVNAPEELSGNIASNKTLTADREWFLKGSVYVTEGATLTIEPGTVIKGYVPKTTAEVNLKGALVIERGAKINATGTADKPIVFTSGMPAGQRKPGDWGGVVILGRATTNQGANVTIEGGIGRQYGGTNDDDNSGTMKYVRIEFAGISAEPGSEINSLTLGAVGRGTTLEYIQSIYGNDDAFEFFGGTVNAKYLVAYATADDDFDFDFGYRGTIQFAVSLRNPKFVDSADPGNGIECDNDKNGTTATPTTRPVLSNFTFVGPNNATGTAANHNFANRFRKATNFVLNNSILLGYQKAGLSLESDGTVNSYVAGTSEFKNNLVFAVAEPFKTDRSAIFTIAQMEAKAIADGGLKLTTAAEVKLTSPFALTSPSFLPQVGSPALMGTFANSNNLFTSTTYRGAFGTTNWLQGWSSFDFTANAEGAY